MRQEKAIDHGVHGGTAKVKVEALGTESTGAIKRNILVFAVSPCAPWSKEDSKP
ncbi:MAG: hypothetical protein K9J43_01390 [Polynucleobacter sp.]|nr:hypothetical protein [Polynucleobacter sp.]